MLEGKPCQLQSSKPFPYKSSQFLKLSNQYKISQGHVTVFCKEPIADRQQLRNTKMSPIQQQPFARVPLMQEVLYFICKCEVEPMKLAKV